MSGFWSKRTTNINIGGHFAHQQMTDAEEQKTVGATTHNPLRQQSIQRDMQDADNDGEIKVTIKDGEQVDEEGNPIVHSEVETDIYGNYTYNGVPLSSNYKVPRGSGSSSSNPPAGSQPGSQPDGGVGSTENTINEKRARLNQTRRERQALESALQNLGDDGTLGSSDAEAIARRLSLGQDYATKIAGLDRTSLESMIQNKAGIEQNLDSDIKDMENEKLRLRAQFRTAGASEESQRISGKSAAFRGMTEGLFKYFETLAAFQKEKLPPYIKLAQEHKLGVLAIGDNTKVDHLNFAVEDRIFHTLQQYGALPKIRFKIPEDKIAEARGLVDKALEEFRGTPYYSQLQENITITDDGYLEMIDWGAIDVSGFGYERQDKGNLSSDMQLYYIPDSNDVPHFPFRNQRERDHSTEYLDLAPSYVNVDEQQYFKAFKRGDKYYYTDENGETKEAEAQRIYAKADVRHGRYRNPDMTTTAENMQGEGNPPQNDNTNKQILNFFVRVEDAQRDMDESLPPQAKMWQGMLSNVGLGGMLGKAGVREAAKVAKLINDGKIGFIWGMVQILMLGDNPISNTIKRFAGGKSESEKLTEEGAPDKSEQIDRIDDATLSERQEIINNLTDPEREVIFKNLKDNKITSAEFAEMDGREDDYIAELNSIISEAESKEEYELKDIEPLTKLRDKLRDEASIESELSYDNDAVRKSFNAVSPQM